MLRDSVVAVVVVRTRPRAMPLAMITMRKSTNRALSRNAKTKDFARPTSLPVRAVDGQKQSFLFPWDSNGHRVIKVYLVWVFFFFPI